VNNLLLPWNRVICRRHRGGSRFSVLSELKWHLIPCEFPSIVADADRQMTDHRWTVKNAFLCSTYMRLLVIRFLPRSCGWRGVRDTTRYDAFNKLPAKHFISIYIQGIWADACIQSKVQGVHLLKETALYRCGT